MKKRLLTALVLLCFANPALALPSLWSGWYDAKLFCSFNESAEDIRNFTDKQVAEHCRKANGSLLLNESKYTLINQKGVFNHDIELEKPMANTPCTKTLNENADEVMFCYDKENKMLTVRVDTEDGVKAVILFERRDI